MMLKSFRLIKMFITDFLIPFVLLTTLVVVVFGTLYHFLGILLLNDMFSYISSLL